MGFEINYHYHEKKDGVYNKDEVKILKKKVGEPFDDTPLEKAASAIMSQLARRDIFVVDVNVYELTKKEISFKESNGGIVLKNRKFSFDQSTTFVEVIEETPKLESKSVIHPHEQLSISKVSKSPITWMVFSPELPQLNAVKNFKLTVDKKYPVYEKILSSNGIGENLRILDDIGREIVISDQYFIPGQINLLGDKELGFSDNKKTEIQLNWGSQTHSDVPILRK